MTNVSIINCIVYLNVTHTTRSKQEMLERLSRAGIIYDVIEVLRNDMLYMLSDSPRARCSRNINFLQSEPCVSLDSVNDDDDDNDVSIATCESINAYTLSSYKYC